ncbi:hypothetical protein KI688_012866 [Linnemannia hyalina]|uniref:Transmembrane protein n=1 Tax=Linnemannia hyalina TaxID=64524 RepID=A0A9P8BSC5_9FUNG|nr:hypothetical protein KI688_012866 [Linnemannia hyalina]
MSTTLPNEGIVVPAHSRMVPDVDETISLLVSLGCITVMSTLFGRKTAGTKMTNINYARGLVIALYLISWMFSLMATQLVQTNDYNMVSCMISIYTCIALYAGSKIIIYLFLMEKVYVVTAVGLTRSNFWLYKVNLMLLSPYLVIVALMIIFRVHNINAEGQCHIGLLRPAALPLILYDVFLSVWLTGLFIQPLISSKSMLQGPSKGRLREVARRTLIGALMALVLSSANIFTLVYFEGNERGLVCLSCCTADVTLNAITIHWVTSRGALQMDETGHGKRGGGGYVHRGGHGGGGGGYVSQHLMSFSEKQVGPVESHITVEAYVDEFHSSSFYNNNKTSGGSNGLPSRVVI